MGNKVIQLTYILPNIDDTTHNITGILHLFIYISHYSVTFWIDNDAVIN